WRAPGWGNSTYNALNVKVEKRFSQGMNLLATYTWSKFLEDTIPGNELAGASAGGQQSYYARHLDKGLSGNDVRHRFTASFVYELPVGKNKLPPVGEVDYLPDGEPHHQTHPVGPPQRI